MRILHTADWHLGKTFKGQSLLEDHAHVLEQIFAIIIDEKIDVVIIAGDVYDKPAPTESAVNIYSDFVARVYQQTNASIVIIAGNHDSGDRLGSYETLVDPNRILIRGSLKREERILLREDEHGPVAFSACPFGEIYSARRAFDDETIKSPQDVLEVEIAAAKATVPEGARWVITAHAFVTGGKTSETERDLCVGSVQTVATSIFDGADYVALGHLHRCQTAGRPSITYSGSPLAFGFDEVGSEKSVSIVDLGAEGECAISQIALSPLRVVREVKGLMADLLIEAEKNPNDDYIKAVFTDEGEIIDPAGQLRTFYPNVLQIEREKKRDLVLSGSGRAEAKLTDPKAVVSEFIKFVRDEKIKEVEEGYVDDILSEPIREEV